MFVQIRHKGLQASRLLPEISSGSNQSFQLRQRYATDSLQGEQTGGAQAAERALDVGPGSVLRQVSADDDFKSRSSRPPVLASPGTKQGFVVGPDLFFIGPRFLCQLHSFQSMTKPNRRRHEGAEAAKPRSLNYIRSCPAEALKIRRWANSAQNAPLRETASAGPFSP